MVVPIWYVGRKPLYAQTERPTDRQRDQVHDDIGVFGSEVYCVQRNTIFGLLRKHWRAFGYTAVQGVVGCEPPPQRMTELTVVKLL